MQTTDNFRVFAENACGLSKPSEVTEPILAENPIETPTRPGKPAVVEVSCWLVKYNYNMVVIGG